MSGPGALDDGAAAARCGPAASSPDARAALPLPAELQQLADAILVAQQRIQRAALPHDVTAQLSRAVRRAVQTSRADVPRAHLVLARLHRDMDALGC